MREIRVAIEVSSSAVAFDGGKGGATSFVCRDALGVPEKINFIYQDIKKTSLPEGCNPLSDKSTNQAGFRPECHSMQ
jgi:hypothetical protein